VTGAKNDVLLLRCVHVTDIGIGYISTMLALHTLYLRWCTQIRDFGLQHICGMRSMQVLSLAGMHTLSQFLFFYGKESII
jgi:F-box/leucine-rich repeat protein 16